VFEWRLARAAPPVEIATAVGRTVVAQLAAAREQLTADQPGLLDGAVGV
jgi:hypothetical protein